MCQREACPCVGDAGAEARSSRRRRWVGVQTGVVASGLFLAADWALCQTASTTAVPFHPWWEAGTRVTGRLCTEVYPTTGAQTLFHKSG